mgnify:CR=1 FL=1
MSENEKSSQSNASVDPICYVADLAQRATSDLFCDGLSNAAERLVIETLDGKDGGGHCREAVESAFLGAIKEALAYLQLKIIEMMRAT